MLSFDRLRSLVICAVLAAAGYDATRLVASGIQALATVPAGGTSLRTMTPNAVLYGNGTSPVGLAVSPNDNTMALCGSNPPAFGTTCAGGNPSVGNIGACQSSNGGGGFLGDDAQCFQNLTSTTPPTPMVSNVGTPGAATYTYCVTTLPTAPNAIGESVCSPGASTATSQDPPNGTNFNVIATTCGPLPPGSILKVYLSAAGAMGTKGQLGVVVCGSSFNDQSGAGAPPGPPIFTDFSLGESLSGSLRVQGQVAIGGSYIADNTILLVNTNNAIPTENGTPTGENLLLNTIPGAAWNAIYGLFSFTQISDSGSAFPGNAEVGIANNVNYFARGGTSALYGDYEATQFAPGDATTSGGAFGSYRIFITDGPITSNVGYWAGVTQGMGSSTVTNYGTYISAPVISGGGTIATNTAFFNENQCEAGVTTCYAWHSLGGENNLATGSATTVGVKILADVAQTANIQEWDDSTEMPISFVDAAGSLTLGPLSGGGSIPVCVNNNGKLVQAVSLIAGLTTCP